MFDKHWGIRWKRFPAASSQLVKNSPEAFEGRSLKIMYPGKTLGTHLRANYSTDFKKIGVPLKEAMYLRYYIKFHKGWDWGISGKIPGLAGNQQVSGGNPNDGTNGWSMRFVWYEGEKVDPARAAIYAYVAGKGGKRKTDKYGYVFRFVHPETKKYMNYPVDKWVCIEQYVKLNDIGKYNGTVKAWMDGVLAVNLNDLMYRTVNNEANKVGQMMFSTFFGGGSDAWAPNHDVYASFDNFALSESRIGCK